MKSIRSKIILAFASVTLLALIISSLIFLSMYNRSLIEGERFELERLSLSVLDLIAAAEHSGANRDELLNEMQYFARLENVSISLTGEHGDGFFSVSPVEPGRPAPETMRRGLPPGAAMRGRMGNFIDSTDDDEDDDGDERETTGAIIELPWANNRMPGMSFEVEVDISGLGGDELVVSIFRENRLSSQFLLDAVFGVLLSTIAALIVSLSAGYMFSKRLSSPIIALRNSAQSISRGDYSARAHIVGVDETAQLGLAFNEMAENLEKNIRQLRQERDGLRTFLEDASHELRTPLTNIMTSNQLLASQLDAAVQIHDERLRGIFSANEQSAHVMKQILDGLLSLTRLSSGIRGGKREPVEVLPLVRAVLAGRLGRDHDITFSHSKTCSDVMCESTALWRIVQNIVENSVNAGAQSLVLGCSEETHNDTRLSISFIDDGRGMTSEQLLHASKRFYKGPGSSGSGLGLAICKDLVEANGGVFEIFSPPIFKSSENSLSPSLSADNGGTGTEVRLTFDKA